MIHTIRTVAVGDQESKIDSPIILYRGDREVEVEFTINGSKFTFTNGGNVIKSTNATHGQLVINTPTGENMFSEVTECHDGKVVFVITKEMIDELIEVGFYSFQIRLFDEGQVSRVTIPPVLKGIDIRNPIAAEDETNVVDIGSVDYAVVVKDEFEDLSTFLPDGNYNKTEWESKDVISGAKLNKIEDALYNINSNMEATDLALLNKVENINRTVYGEIDKLGNELESEVEEFERSFNINAEQFKIDTNATITTHKNEVSKELEVVNSKLEVVNSKLGYKANKDDIFSMANMGQDIREAMTGGSVAVVGDNCIMENNIIDEQVTDRKIRSVSLNKIVINNDIPYDLSNITGSGITEIENGVNISQNPGSSIDITIPLSGLENGQYEFSFDYISNNNVSAMASYWLVYTSSISEEYLVFSPTTNNKTFSRTFYKDDSMTKIIYRILCSNLNVDLDITNAMLSNTGKTVQDKLNNIKDDINDLNHIYDELSDAFDICNYTILEVDPSFSSNTIGYGVNKFSSLLDAHDYTDGKSSKNNRFIIKVYPGRYDDWGVRYAGVDNEVGETYLGIRVNDYVYFESTDIEHPENYILVWDGHDGFSENYTMNRTQAMRRCLFHLDKRPLHTHIKGFTLKSKNTRYCIHPETAGTGWGNTWSIENCIFDWSGCPDVTGYSGATVGIGISSGETGLIKNCKWANTGYGGIVGHNNGFAVNQWNAEKPFFVDGAKLTIENCDLNGCSVTQDTLKDDIDGFDCLTVKNCRGIGSINITGLQGNATKSNWKIDVMHSEIIDEGNNT